MTKCDSSDILDAKIAAFPSQRLEFVIAQSLPDWLTDVGELRCLYRVLGHQFQLGLSFRKSEKQRGERSRFSIAQNFASSSIQSVQVPG